MLVRVEREGLDVMAVEVERPDENALAFLRPRRSFSVARVAVGRAFKRHQFPGCHVASRSNVIGDGVSPGGFEFSRHVEIDDGGALQGSFRDERALSSAVYD